jgi:hypothetical protein
MNDRDDFKFATQEQRERLAHMRARELKIAFRLSGGRTYGVAVDKYRMRRRRLLDAHWREQLERAPPDPATEP